MPFVPFGIRRVPAATRLLLPALLAWTLALAPARADDDAPDLIPGAVEHMVPMRDGVRLATNVFLPKGDGPWPVILTRTPYSKDNRQFAMLTGRYVNADYVAVVQDCRGRFRSEGQYTPFEDDFEDGKDTLDWIAKQDFCNGKIGVTGPSAMGITANLCAATGHPALKAAYVVVAPQSMLGQGSFMGGVLKEADTIGWLKGQDAIDRVDEIRNRPTIDDRWRAADFNYKLDDVKIPIYNVGGWFDIFNQGNVDNFVYLQNKGAEGARGNQKLFMGPFGHGNLTGDLRYPKDMGLVGAVRNELRWFDYWLKGEQNGIMDEPPVQFYMMASARKGKESPLNGYRTAENWPPPSAETRLYLQPDRSLSKNVPPAEGGGTTYSFDPANPVQTFGGANLRLALGPQDQRQVGDRQDYLRFETPVLEENLEIAGQVFVELWAATDGPDTDFVAKLIDVYPDGYEALLLDAPIRARYRGGIEPENVKPMTPGKPEKLTIDLWSVANIFEKGHKLAVHVTSSNAPRFEVNPNDGAAPGEKAEPRVARNTIYHDAEHPSAVVLPVLAN